MGPAKNGVAAQRRRDWTSNGRVSYREAQVLQAFADGNEMYSVASLLGISYATVDTHRTNIHMKLGTHSLHHAVAIGFRKGWIR